MAFRAVITSMGSKRELEGLGNEDQDSDERKISAEYQPTSTSRCSEISSLSHRTKLCKTACLLPQAPAAADVDGGGNITQMEIKRISAAKFNDN